MPSSIISDDGNGRGKSSPDKFKFPQGTAHIVDIAPPELSFPQRIRAYEKQAEDLGGDVDILCTVPLCAMEDLRGAALALVNFGKPVYITISLDKHGYTLEYSVPAKGALLLLQEMGVSGLALDFACNENRQEILNDLLPYARIPLFVKDGDVWKEARSQLNPEEKQDLSFVFVNDRQLFYLEPDTTEISSPIHCLPDMEDAITEACEEAVDILLVQVNLPDDALDFSRNAHMATLPVMFSSDSEEALDAALMLYQGRALIDSESTLPEEVLAKLARKYGSVIY